MLPFKCKDFLGEKKDSTLHKKVLPERCRAKEVVFFVVLAPCFFFLKKIPDKSRDLFYELCWPGDLSKMVAPKMDVFSF